MPNYSPQSPVKGRRYKCSKCRTTTKTLGELRSHHAKKHPQPVGERAARYRKVKGHPVLHSLPTTKAPTKPVGTKPTKIAVHGAVRFCPNCGFGVSKLRVMS